MATHSRTLAQKFHGQRSLVGYPGENARSWGALGEARPGQSSLSAGLPQAWLPAGFSRIALYSLEQEGLLQTDPGLAPGVFTDRPLDHKPMILVPPPNWWLECLWLQPLTLTTLDCAMD